MNDRKRIMVVEDDPSVRLLIAEILREAGHEVVEYGSSEDALAEFESTHPDLITLDLAMPSMDGVEFLEALRQRADAARVAVVVVTAAPESLRNQLSEKAQETVAKPFHMDQLLDVVERALGRRQTAA